jgi:hypothetical protein
LPRMLTGSSRFSSDGLRLAMQLRNSGLPTEDDIQRALARH